MTAAAPDHLVAAFREETAERIADLETCLLDLERAPPDAELVDRAFRTLHTIKGSAAMFGFDEAAALAHDLENAFELLRAGELAVTRELVGLALRGKDLLRALLDGAAPPDAAEPARLAEALRALLPGAGPAPSTAAAPRRAGMPGDRRRTYRVQFRPHPDLLRDGTSPLGLLAELRTLGPCVVAARTDGLPTLDDLDPECCYLSWDVTITTDQGQRIRDAFMFVEGRCELGIELVEDAVPGGGERRRGERPSPVEPARTVRVASAKLDRLVDLVGELVIAQARLSRAASRIEDPELLSVSEDVDRLTSELRDRTLDVRMVPIGTTFGRFQRLVRDLAGELGKEIALVTEGSETELDKTVIERLADPLVHLIRNSCDHGIEAPDLRREAGKPPCGTIRLAASHSGPSVLVEIQDDGAGLDADAIRARAVERGLLSPEARPSARELFDLVFTPGFSTAREVSSISGRGVGMDVVKRAVEALRGTLTLESSRGVGTTVRIELPLTLAIIEGLLVSVGDSSYVLPLSAVEECVELTRQEVERARGARTAQVRGELVPYLRLRETFEVPGPPPELEQIAIVRHAERRCGLVVDGVVGQHQTVIKSLGQLYRHVEGLSGATILGDGTVALIVDVPALVQRAMAGA